MKTRFNMITRSKAKKIREETKELDIISRNQEETFMKKFLKFFAEESKMSLVNIKRALKLYISILSFLVGKKYLYPITRSGEAMTKISQTLVSSVMSIGTQTTAYIIQNPEEIATCSASIYLSKDRKSFKEELLLLYEEIGKERLEELNNEALMITHDILEQYVPRVIKQNFPSITNSAVNSLLELQAPTTTEIQVIEESDIQIQPYRNRLQRTDVVERSSLEIMAKDAKCALINFINNSPMISIDSDCEQYFLETRSMSSLKQRCPRVHQDLERMLDRTTQDFKSATTKAIGRAVEDIDISMSRVQYDVMNSVQLIPVLILIFVLFSFIWRNVFVRLSRRLFGFTRGKPRKSVRKPRKSVRKPRKSVRKSFGFTKRKSTRKPRNQENLLENNLYT